VVVSLPVLLFKGRTFRFSLKAFRFEILRQIAVIGFPYFISRTCVVLSVRIINHFAFSLSGTIGVAALAIATNLSSSCSSIVESGIEGTARILAGVLIGHRDITSLRNLPRVIAKVAIPAFAAAYAVVFIFSNQFSVLLGAEAEHLTIYVNAIRIGTLWFFSHFLLSPPKCIYQAMGNIKMACVSSFVQHIIGPVIAGLLLSKVFGISAVFASHLVGELVVALFYAAFFTVKARRLPHSPLELCYIPNTISAESVNRFNAAISNTKDAIETSKAIYDFCLERGLSKRTAFISSLFIEEMAMDTVKNRIQGKNRTMDVRVICESGHINIILRDDCPPFNPSEWLNLCTPKDKNRSIGIRLALDMAQHVNYTNVLGMNVLQLQL